MSDFERFDDLPIPGPLADALADMGFEAPTPIQAQAIPHALEGRDVLGTAQTGTGKTGAFGIPLLANLYKEPSHQALILAPTRELAAQIYQVLKQMSRGLHIRCALVVGGESFRRQADEFDAGIDVVIATPGRLNDHLQERTFSLRYVYYVVLDEVDRMLDMGFAPQVKRIMRHVPVKRQTLLFSATLPKEALDIAHSFLRDPVRVAVETVASEVDPQISETTINTTNEGKKTVVLQEVKAREGRILIFTRTKTRADSLYRMLQQAGLPVVNMHGGRSHSQRKQALDQFRRGTKRIMVATDLAGRGIDVEGIEHVINFDIPSNREDYIHRMGRTGRFGRKGTVLNLMVTGDQESERVLAGKKAPSRVVFRSHRGRRRR